MVCPREIDRHTNTHVVRQDINKKGVVSEKVCASISARTKRVWIFKSVCLKNNNNNKSRSLSCIVRAAVNINSILAMIEQLVLPPTD